MKQINVGQLPQMDYFVQQEVDRLRVAVGFAGSDKKVIMVTSSEPNEGKSFISVALWNELANAGKRVCLIDADMRKSMLRSTLRLTVKSGEFLGLAHYLAGQTGGEDVLYSTERENAYLIPTTTLVNPSLLLEGRRLESLLDRLRTIFDYVIIDTPPLGVAADGQVIAAKCDACVLVVRAHVTKRRMVRSSLQQIESVNCPLLGIVLNRLEGGSGDRTYSKYYYSKHRTDEESGNTAAKAPGKTAEKPAVKPPVKAPIKAPIKTPLKNGTDGGKKS